MSRKYNARHTERGRSNYGLRLIKRGLSKAPALPSLDHLRSVQEARQRRAGSPFPTAADRAQQPETAEVAA